MGSIPATLMSRGGVVVSPLFSGVIAVFQEGPNTYRVKWTVEGFGPYSK